jgi:hypothetical protein
MMCQHVIVTKARSGGVYCTARAGGAEPEDLLQQACARQHEDHRNVD